MILVGEIDFFVEVGKKIRAITRQEVKNAQPAFLKRFLRVENRERFLNLLSHNVVVAGLERGQTWFEGGPPGTELSAEWSLRRPPRFDRSSSRLFQLGQLPVEFRSIWSNFWARVWSRVFSMMIFMTAFSPLKQVAKSVDNVPELFPSSSRLQKSSSEENDRHSSARSS